jgi:hypothetical protein
MCFLSTNDVKAAWLYENVAYPNRDAPIFTSIKKVLFVIRPTIDVTTLFNVLYEVADSLVPVQSIHCSHIFWLQLEIEDVDVFL